MDTPPVTTPPAQTPLVDNAAVTAVAQDALDDVALARQLIASLKAKGLAGATALLPQLIATGQKDYADITAALPSIKAGYKTTEFWLIVATVLLNGGYSMATGKTLPVDVNAVLGGLVAIYTAARALVKGSAAATK